MAVVRYIILSMPDTTRVENNPTYPYITRSVIDLYNAGRLDAVTSIFVEPEYGYFVQLTYRDGSRRITFGNDLGLNTGSAGDLAKDKGHTKKLLRQHGIACPDGAEFMLPWWQQRIAKSIDTSSRGPISIDRITADITTYISQYSHYPVYIKPITGSKGGLVYKVHTADQVHPIVTRYEEERVRLAIVEEAIDAPDYRIVVLDGKLISAYRRIPLTVHGDGNSTMYELLQRKNQAWKEHGRDTNFQHVMKTVVEEYTRRGLSMDTIPPDNDTVQLLPVSNLSLGGDADDVTTTIHGRWVSLARDIAAHMGLRLAGIDLACDDITDGQSAYSVLEVNASPGLDHYAMSGIEQEKIVQSLYREVLNVSAYIHDK